jgi:purine-nucleoside phosphorylase
MNESTSKILQQRLKEATDFLTKAGPLQAKVGLVLGSGLGPIVDRMSIEREFNYNDIPHFHSTTVLGHQGRLVYGTLAGVKLLVMQGRIHAYEGHTQDDVVFPVRLLKSLGVANVILTNAAGGINTDYSPGQLVLIKDHLNLTGNNPLLGKNHDFLGERFPDLSEVYPKSLRSIFKQSAEALGFKLPEGIYAGVLGPTYETPAEVRMLRVLGADLVGMSTVPESIAAHHAGLKVIGISCVTNMAAGILEQKLRHEDIKDEASKAMNNLGNLLEKSLAALS